MTSARLSHIDRHGQANMVSIETKPVTNRTALATCEILMKPETLKLLKSGTLKKGDAFTVAQIAGIQAAKKTSDLIPLCHPLVLEHIEVRFPELPEEKGIRIEAEVKTSAKTGVEMEALSAASVAALTLYDMAKALEPGMLITRLHLVKKTGGKSEYSDQSGCLDRE